MTSPALAAPCCPHGVQRFLLCRECIEDERCECGALGDPGECEHCERRREALKRAITPGPWQIKSDYPHRPESVTIIANVDGEGHPDGTTTHTFDFIATCEDEFGEYAENAEANARAIAAVPKLIAAIEMLLVEFENEFSLNPAIETGKRALKEAGIRP